MSEHHIRNRCSDCSFTMTAPKVYIESNYLHSTRQHNWTVLFMMFMLSTLFNISNPNTVICDSTDYLSRNSCVSLISWTEYLQTEFTDLLVNSRTNRVCHDIDYAMFAINNTRYHPYEHYDLQFILQEGSLHYFIRLFNQISIMSFVRKWIMLWDTIFYYAKRYSLIIVLDIGMLWVVKYLVLDDYVDSPSERQSL
eukprot:7493_1